MENTELFAHISSLPETLREQVADFVALLKQQHKPLGSRKERKFGCGKGFFVMGPDFDEPLEDFKDYM